MSNFLSVSIMNETTTILIALLGTELSNSRRWLDVSDCQYVKSQYKVTNSVTVRIEFSTDSGSTWNTLCSENTAGGNNPFFSDWELVPDTARGGDILTRCLAFGGGLMETVNFVEMRYR